MQQEVEFVINKEGKVAVFIDDLGFDVSHCIPRAHHVTLWGPKGQRLLLPPRAFVERLKAEGCLLLVQRKAPTIWKEQIVLAKGR
jgi:hypothetical protein